MRKNPSFLEKKLQVTRCKLQEFVISWLSN